MKSVVISKVRARHADLACRQRELSQKRIEEVKQSIMAMAREHINRTGHCTVRELVLEMVNGKMGDTCELAFPLPDGRRVNVEVRITKLEEKP